MDCVSPRLLIPAQLKLSVVRFFNTSSYASVTRVFQKSSVGVVYLMIISNSFTQCNVARVVSFGWLLQRP